MGGVGGGGLKLEAIGDLLVFAAVVVVVLGLGVLATAGDTVPPSRCSRLGSSSEIIEENCGRG